MQTDLLSLRLGQPKLVALTESIVARGYPTGRCKTATSTGQGDLCWSMESYTGHGCLAILVTFGAGVTKLLHAIACSGNRDSWKDEDSHVVQHRKNQATP